MNTLGEIIKNYEGQRVKLGSLSGFFYCGEITTDFNNNLSELDVEFYTALEKRIEGYKKIIAGTEKTLCEYRLNLRSKKRKLKAWDGSESGKAILEDRIENLKKNIDSKVEFINSIKSAMTTCEEKMDNLVPLTERSVREIYKSILYEDVTIILIEGEEVGKYWDIDECGEEEENARTIRGYNKFQLCGD